MELLKKHYEKVVLGVVLLGLVAGSIFLILMIPAERRTLEEKSSEIINRPAKPLPPPDLAKASALLARAGSPDCLDLTSLNKLFNSMPWQQRPDGTRFKIALGTEVGPNAIVVTRITNLNLTMTFETVEKIGDTLYYVIQTVNEAATKTADRRRRSSAMLNVKKDNFTIREVRGPADNPTELVLELADTGEQVVLAKDRPYVRVEGYMADFKYPPENRTWTNKRVGDGGPGTTPITFAGESYIVVAIGKNEIVLSAKSNNKKTVRPFTP
jgi:hypothetical protein